MGRKKNNEPPPPSRGDGGAGVANEGFMVRVEWRDNRPGARILTHWCIPDDPRGVSIRRVEALAFDWFFQRGAIVLAIDLGWGERPKAIIKLPTTLQ